MRQAGYLAAAGLYALEHHVGPVGGRQRPSKKALRSPRSPTLCRIGRADRNQHLVYSIWPET